VHLHSKGGRGGVWFFWVSPCFSLFLSASIAATYIYLRCSYLYSWTLCIKCWV
jgi:hypothetical protein